MLPPRTSARIERLRFSSWIQLSKILQECIGAGISGRRKEELASRLSAGRRIRQDSHIRGRHAVADRKSTRLNSSHRCISYAVFCLKKKKHKDFNRIEA